MSPHHTCIQMSAATVGFCLQLISVVGVVRSAVWPSLWQQPVRESMKEGTAIILASDGNEFFFLKSFILCLWVILCSLTVARSIYSANHSAVKLDCIILGPEDSIPEIYKMFWMLHFKPPQYLSSIRLEMTAWTIIILSLRDTILPPPCFIFAIQQHLENKVGDRVPAPSEGVQVSRGLVHEWG